MVSLSVKRGNSKQLQKDKDELKDKLQKLEKDYDDLAKEKAQLEIDIDDLRRDPIVPEIVAPVKAMVVEHVCIPVVNNYKVDRGSALIEIVKMK